MVMVHIMSKRFNYILSQFKFEVTTFCNMNSNYFYDLNYFYDRYQEGLDEKLKLLSKVSFAMDVLYNIENACSTSFLINVELFYFALCFMYPVNIVLTVRINI